MAAVLAIGDGAVLSHRSAASLWALLPARIGFVEITVRGDGGRRKRAGIRVHRSASLTGEQVTRRRGIPTTTPSQTIADLRGEVAADELRRALRQAAVLGFATGSDVGDDRTRSELETLFLRLCRRHRLRSSG
jgi:hypothetical protein